MWFAMKYYLKFKQVKFLKFANKCFYVKSAEILQNVQINLPALRHFLDKKTSSNLILIWLAFVFYYLFEVRCYSLIILDIAIAKEPGPIWQAITKERGSIVKNLMFGKVFLISSANFWASVKLSVWATEILNSPLS